MYIATSAYTHYSARLTSAQILEHEFNSGHLEFVYGALEDADAVQRAMSRDANQIRVVIHSAAQASHAAAINSAG